MKYYFRYLLLLRSFRPFQLSAQQVDLSCVWPAQWISSDGPKKEFAVHYFRKTFDLDTIPDRLVVHTSGDTRYQLFVNGQMLTWGPLTGDLRHWYYETTDIAPFLKKGKNIIAASVLNYGSHPPDSRLTVQTAFLLAADEQIHQFLNTQKDSWKAAYDPAYSPNVIDGTQVNGYYGGGSREIIDGRKHLWGWNKLDYDDTRWQSAPIVERAYAKGCKWASRWKLTPRALVHEKLTPSQFESIRIQENVEVQGDFCKNQGSIQIPANTKARIVLDWGHETTAYPVLNISQGRDAIITSTYVEAPYLEDAKKKIKGNRNEVDGKIFFGYFDRFIADGGENRIYKPFWWRAFRYVEISIETRDAPLTINQYSAIHSAYPFEQKVTFALEDAKNGVDENKLQTMMEIGHRTIMACAHEHFMDCPYYEESQFEGDTRIQALVSYYNYGDPTLGKNAIEQFSWSINEEGFLSARYPTNSLYYIPNYSIYWIGMLHDYMMLYEDSEFIKSKLPVVRQILSYFEQNERPDGTLKQLDYHQFVDWSFKQGEAPRNQDGQSAVVDLHYLLALQWAIDLERNFGKTYFADAYQATAQKLATSIRKKYWNPALQFFTDIPDDPSKLSQHTNCLAILTGITQGEEAKGVMEKVLYKEGLTKATLYWSFYVFEALERAGLGDEYLNNLQVWESVMDLGVTTWPESGPNSRSECHAWGASPNYHFLKTVAGVSSAAPGFKKVRIQPNFGNGEMLKVRFPHHAGDIELDLKKDQQQLKGQIILPQNIKAILVWNGQEVELDQTLNIINH